MSADCEERKKQLCRDRGKRYRLRHPERIKALNAKRAKAKAAWAKANWDRVKEQKKKSYRKRPESKAAYGKKWDRLNSEKRRGYSRKYYWQKKPIFQARKAAEAKGLADNYVKSQLRQRTRLSARDIPAELVELKRAQLKLHRKIKTQTP